MQTPAQMSPQHQIAATGNATAAVAAAVVARANEEAKGECEMLYIGKGKR